MSELTGRELDAEIAERCFDLHVEHYPERRHFYYIVYAPREIADPVPYYSEHMADAWQVAEWIREQTGVFELVWDVNRWVCGYMELSHDIEDTIYEHADTAPEAICRAALEVAKLKADK